MTGNEEVSETRNKFEEYLRTYRPKKRDGSPPDENTPVDLSAYRAYIRVKKEAMKRGEDPIRAFREELAKTQNGEMKALKFWLNAVGKRIANPEEEDIRFVREALAKKEIDLDMVGELLGGDRRKIADIVCALHLDVLESAPYAAVYLIIDRLVCGKTKSSTPPVPNAKNALIMDQIPEESIASKPEVYELLKKYGIEEWQARYQADADKAEAEIQARIAECTDRSKRTMLGEIFSYFKELQSHEIPGIVDRVFDTSTCKMEPFPAIHQKIGARFIATEKRVLIADNMGLGKTAQAIIAKNLIDKQEGRKMTAVVVVPNNIVAQWVDEIGTWNLKGKSVVVVRSENKDEAVAQAEKEKPDFVIVTYDMISRKVGAKKVSERLGEIADYLVVDESHKAKNQGAQRSVEVMDMSRQAKYVALLSGTPVPNRITDLGVVASILSGHRYEPEEFNKRYRKNPRVVREEILPHMLRRGRRETFGQGRCETHLVRVPMTDAQQKEHERIMLNTDERGALELIMQLRKCALDPRLVGIPEASPKYAKLKELLGANYDETPQVIFSSELKSGVLDVLENELAEYGLSVARIDGDPQRSGKNREKILSEIKAGKYEVVIATLETLGEGVNQLTVANKAYFLDVPFTQAEYDQGVARLDRKGQVREVDIYVLVSEESIDEALLWVKEQKKRLGEFVVDGFELTDFEKRIIEEGEHLVQGSQDPLKRMYNFFGTITNRRSVDILKLLRDPEIGRYVAETYWEHFEGSYYGNTTNLIASVIRGMEERRNKSAGGVRSARGESTNGAFVDILDIASGPCCLARVLGRPIVSLDANPMALAVGREKLGERAGRTVEGSFTALPFSDGAFELAVMSLALLHSRPEERETILREANRILRADGRFMITLPSGEGRYELLTRVLPLLGFSVIDEVSGTARSADKPDFECVMICARKTGEPQTERIPIEMFDFVPRKMHSESCEASVASGVKKRICSSFEIDGKDSLEAAKESGPKEDMPSTPPEPIAATALEPVVPKPPEPIAREKKAEEMNECAGHEKPTITIDQDVEDTIGQLYEKFGSAQGIVDNCGAEELAKLGLEAVRSKKKGGDAIIIRKVVSEQMLSDHAKAARKMAAGLPKVRRGTKVPSG